MVQIFVNKYYSWNYFGSSHFERNHPIRGHVYLKISYTTNMFWLLIQMYYDNAFTKIAIILVTT